MRLKPLMTVGEIALWCKIPDADVERYIVALLIEATPYGQGSVPTYRDVDARKILAAAEVAGSKLVDDGARLPNIFHPGKLLLAAASALTLSGCQLDGNLNLTRIQPPVIHHPVVAAPCGNCRPVVTVPASPQTPMVLEPADEAPPAPAKVAAPEKPHAVIQGPALTPAEESPPKPTEPPVEVHEAKKPSDAELPEMDRAIEVPNLNTRKATGWRPVRRS